MKSVLPRFAFLALILSAFVQWAVIGQNQPQKKIVKPTSGWRSTSSRSVMDGIVTTILYTDATNNPAASLAIRCGGGKAEAYVQVGDYVQPELGGDHTVRVKFDAATSRTEGWDDSTSSKGLFCPYAPQLIRELMNSKKFLFEFTPYEKSATVLSFNVTGLERALNPVAKSCGEIPAQVDNQ